MTFLSAPPPPPIDEISDVVPLAQGLWRFCAEYVLGTRLEVLVHSASHASAKLAVHAARAEIERLNRILNHRRSDSEISGLLRASRAIVSADLFAVLQLSETWRAISRGAFDGRMGALLQLWAGEAEPNPLAVEHALSAVRRSTITLDPAQRGVELSPALALSLDGVAKGYIVDKALDAARRAAPTAQGMAINIGGDIRCWGTPPASRGWHIGVPDPAVPTENASLVDAVSVSNAAIATSGRGPRDRIGNAYRSKTISPFTGYPIDKAIAASVVASHAADADAIATACLVLHPDESIALVDRLEGVAARITEADGRVRLSRDWPALQLVQNAGSSSNANKQSVPPLPAELRWPRFWSLTVTYRAPDFSATDSHIPYIALWITDAENRPINTLLLLGTDPRWAKDNFIWWDSYSERAEEVIYSRSRPTTSSGRYDLEWAGVDENVNPVPIGNYILHLETSREKGKHVYRSIPITIGRERFTLSSQDSDGMGSLEIAFKPYLDSPPA